MTGGQERVDGWDKVTGRARYAGDHAVGRAVTAVPVRSTVARGRIVRVDDGEALRQAGVLAVITPDNAPRLAEVHDAELMLFQNHRIAYRGQFVAAVVATSRQAATAAARLVRVAYEQSCHEVRLSADHHRLYEPEHLNEGRPAGTSSGDFAGAFDAAPVRVDETYRTPAVCNNPLETHATCASWDNGRLTLIDSTQGPNTVQNVLAALFRLRTDHVRVICEHVGGAFGAKGAPRANTVLAAMAALVVGRPVTCSFTRRDMFAVAGHRSPTIQRVRLGAHPDGRLIALAHDAVAHTSTLRRFAEQTAAAARHMYAAPHRATSHRLAALDVPSPSWMRAPGYCPGMFALESAMDELAVRTGVDPVDLRLRNDTSVHPETGQLFSSRNLAACLRSGARLFAWAGRNPAPRSGRRGHWLVGTGVAASTYTADVAPSDAAVSVSVDGRYSVSIAAVDVGTGARTMLRSVAARELGVPASAVEIRIGDSCLPRAVVAGGSMGTSSWSWAVIAACRDLRRRVRERGGVVPVTGLTARARTDAEVAALADRARFSFGAQFAEVRVDADTMEIRVPRLLGVFAVGKVLAPALARSQFVGAMTMGLSMALCEEAVTDPCSGDYAQHELATYHIATHADVQDVQASWIEEEEHHLGPSGAKGLGEIGIVGTAAAIANAVYHATGVRVRDLPVRPASLLRAHRCAEPSPHDRGDRGNAAEQP
ncbi:xanthine dehydrogenase [Streptomyces ruber]|uniref:Xanthine dehydrogenase n=2 Tax=Streptomyces TaxID=1883 RepID=A0A918BJ95_9ACTN|nr:xanthine dehydrogenase family protein molybdopterin-binding subunit [Streptomyces ruber]GGQ72955.1 xanthine dehydrogenase [Streptomyces ruber]